MYARIHNGNIVETTNDIKQAVYPSTLPVPYPDQIGPWIKVTGSPEIPDFHRISETNVVLENGVAVFEYEYEEIENAKLSFLSAHVQKIMDGGIVVGGINVRTNSDDRGMLNGAITRAILDDDLNQEYEYHPPGGTPIKISNQQFIAIGRAMSVHVQKCLDVKAALQQNIENYSTKEEIINAFNEGMNE